MGVKGDPPRVMAGHSRSKNGVASLAYAPAIHHFSKKMDARIKSAHNTRLRGR
jgi:hypothetical protein